MKLDHESIAENIPYYLTSHQKEGLVKALAEFPDCNYYTGVGRDEILQGDAWAQLKIFNFSTGESRLLRGIFLSNSCDIAQENKRSLPVKITFVPIVPLARYGEMLVAAGTSRQAVESKFAEIRKQTVTSIFYLPAGSALDVEHIALLDDVHSMPLSNFIESSDRPKIFTLSQVGFYLFTMKLAIHFCRMHEAFVRTEEQVQ